MRSKWKGLFFRNKIYLHKSSILLGYTWKKKFHIHDGRSSKFFHVDREMLGLKVGEFIFTRKLRVVHKKKLLRGGGKKK